ncbi:unnamed protein product [Malus baccata var. baccata]
MTEAAHLGRSLAEISKNIRNRRSCHFRRSNALKREREMAWQESKEPCKKEACNIQACLSKNNFLPQKCWKVIEQLQACCEKCTYNSTHCASVSGLLKQKPK